MDKEMLQPEEAKHSEPNKAFDNLARILRKNFGNPDWNGPFLGKVVKAPPNLEVQIDEFTSSRADNFTQADEKLSKQWEISPEDVATWRKENRYTWHECEDCKTMQLVPSEIHGNVNHFGGVSIAKSREV